MSLCVNNSRDAYQIPEQYYYNSISLNVKDNEIEDLYKYELPQNDYPYNGNQRISFLNSSNSPEMCDENVYQNTSQVEILGNKRTIDDLHSYHFLAKSLLQEDNFIPIDTSNSNCREKLFIPSVNHSRTLSKPKYLINDNDGEKKFISELHINIKESTMNDGDNKFTKSITNDVNGTNYMTVHTCNLQAYVGDNEYEFEPRNSYESDNIQSMSDSPVVKKECHLSEKFIYLAGDSRSVNNTDNQRYELHSYHSPIEMIEDPDQQFSIQSEESVIEDITRSFTSKSVQTSKKLDCIFKNTNDKCIETDLLGVAFKVPKEIPKEVTLKLKSNYHERTQSFSGSNELSVAYSMSSDDKQHKFKPTNIHDHDQKHTVNNCKQSKNYIRPVNKVRSQPSQIESNQDTDICSYSESFVRSNDSYSTEKEDSRPCKFVSNKQSVRRADMMKTNKSILLNKASIKSKSSKRFSDRKEMNMSSETIKNNLAFDGKIKMNNKVEGERHSYEIQCLLDNLNIHLQNTVNSHKTKVGPSKSNITQFNNTSSFWDNPLNPETSRSLFLNKQGTPKILEMSRHKTVNPEIQALFETLDKSHGKPEKGDNSNIRQRKSPKLDLNTRTSKLTSASVNESQSLKKCCEGIGSVDNLNDLRFPSNLKFQKSFELSPYDELVKSHLNSADRRIKSVAAKNGCQIVIEGPISLTDPTSTCQAIRNKIAYRCVVAGTTKDRLDKCLNYLKETFPNTCLRLHNRNSVAVKS